MSTQQRYFPKALLRRRVKPFLIWVSPAVLLVAAVLDVSFSTLVLMSRSGGIQIAGYAISTATFAGVVYPLVVTGSAVNVAAAYGFWVERKWARELVTKWTLTLGIFSTVILSMTLSMPLWQLLLVSWWRWAVLVLAFWYFYRYTAVVEYYRSLDGRSRHSAAAR